MRIESSFNQYALNPTLASILSNNVQKALLELLCCRIGIVQNFYPEDLTADFLIVNKITKGLNSDGSQIVQDWAQIRAKVCYASPHETYPLKQGQECLLFFSDREIESWFINGNTNPLTHSRMHDETDCIALAGLRSMPQMIQILTDTLHLFYGNSDIQLHPDKIISNTPAFTLNTTNSIEENTQNYTLNTTNQTENATTRTITATTTHNGTLSATELNDTTAASGNIVDSEGKVLANVINGIVRSISS